MELWALGPFGWRSSVAPWDRSCRSSRLSGGSRLCHRARYRLLRAVPNTLGTGDLVSAPLLHFNVWSMTGGLDGPPPGAGRWLCQGFFRSFPSLPTSVWIWRLIRWFYIQELFHSPWFSSGVFLLLVGQHRDSKPGPRDYSTESVPLRYRADPPIFK